MNDITTAAKLDLPEQPKLANKVRFVTAASLFDGHDASINIMRRILQSNGAEVIHLGHNRSVDDVVTAALAEDVQGIAISSYQGGHVEYFKYMIDLLRQRGGAHISNWWSPMASALNSTPSPGAVGSGKEPFTVSSVTGKMSRGRSRSCIGKYSR